jgi:hypothetical protein
MITRLLFIGQGREPDAMQTLKFDHLIKDLGDTIIYYGPEDRDTDWIFPAMEKEGIDTTRFSIHLDAELRNKQDDHIIKDFYTYGGWVSQQIIKLLAIDTCKAEQILVQDCDTYLLKEHNFFDSLSNPVPMVERNRNLHPHFYLFVEEILKIKRQTQDSFVTEFMPITKTSWNSLTKHIENTHGKHWLDAIFDTFERVAGLPRPIDDEQPIYDNGKTRLTRFSEYEILGNWQIYDNPNLVLKSQVRFNNDKVDLVADEKYNAYCIRPNYRLEQSKLGKNE